jgi:hypothetical protein
MHQPVTAAHEPLAEELAEGAAESAGVLGLDETAALTGLDETAAVPGGNGNANRAARRSGNGHNGVSAASASSGADTEFGSSSENI